MEGWTALWVSQGMDRKQEPLYPPRALLSWKPLFVKISSAPAFNPVSCRVFRARGPTARGEGVGGP